MKLTFIQCIFVIIQISQRKVVVSPEVCGIINGVVYSLFAHLPQDGADDFTSRIGLDHGGLPALP